MKFDANSSEGENDRRAVRSADSRANLVIVTDYRGLKVADLQTLRGNLRPIGG